MSEEAISVGASYYRARYHDPNSGGFLSEDPEGLGASVNFYAYVDNGPVDWMDPGGLDKVQICCRPLRKAKPFLMIWHHCYIEISDSDGTQTWGILPNKQGSEIPSKDDPRNSGGSVRMCRACVSDRQAEAWLGRRRELRNLPFMWTELQQLVVEIRRI